MAKGSNGKGVRKSETTPAKRQARWISIVFLLFTVILILSMVLSLIK